MILENAILKTETGSKIKKIPCVYFLTNNNDIVYIGKTISFYNRLINHINNPFLVFD